LPPGLELTLWLVIGALGGAAHLLVLRWAVERVRGCTAEVAGRRLVGGYPLRVLAWLPVLAGAAISGLYACLGLVGGLWVGRLAAYRYCARSGTGACRSPDRQD
jgi:hypothetical protein